MRPNEADDVAAELLAADAVGDVIEQWGFRKALGRIWTVLYLAGEPLPAATLGETLQMSAGAVSMALNELQEWAVVNRVWKPGERREFFEAETNLWKMISKVIAERERYLIRSARERLERAEGLLGERGARGADARDRVEQLLVLARVAEKVIDSFLASQKLDFSSFTLAKRAPRLAAIAERARSRARRRKPQ